VRTPRYDILVKPLGAGWEPMGGGWIAPGRRPYNVTHSHIAPGGPGDLSFLLNRPTNRRYNDLQPGCQIAGSVLGSVVWAGQIVSAEPDGAGVWRVDARGPVRHLQEDVTLDKAWVISDMRRWQDMRSYSLSGFGNVNEPSRVEVGNGVATFQNGNGSVLKANSSQGEIVLDLGPNNVAKRIVLTYTSTTGWAATDLLFARTNDIPEWMTGSGFDAFSPAIVNGSAGTTLSGTFSTGKRYVIIFPFRNGAGGTWGADVALTITSILVFTDTAYESGNASILKASTVASTVAAIADTDVVSTSTAGISATTNNLPEFYTDGYQSAYDVIERANVVDRSEWGYTPSLKPEFFYRAQQTGVPLYVARSVDAQRVGSTGVLGDIYNAVRVSYTDAAGTPAQVSVTLSPDTTPLGKIGLTRTAELEVRRPCNSTIATAIGNAYLTDLAKSGLRRPVTFEGAIDLVKGGTSPLAFVRAYDRILLPFEINAQGGMGRIGSATAVSYDHDAQTLEVGVDTPVSSFDKQLARFETLGAW
jgi:hypothetical protein